MYVKGPEKKSTMNSMQAGVDIKEKQKTKTVDKNQWNIELALWKDNKIEKPLTTLDREQEREIPNTQIPNTRNETDPTDIKRIEWDQQLRYIYLTT